MPDDLDDTAEAPGTGLGGRNREPVVTSLALFETLPAQGDFARNRPLVWIERQYSL